MIVDAHFHCDLLSQETLEDLLAVARTHGILALSAGVWPSATCAFLERFSPTLDAIAAEFQSSKKTSGAPGAFGAVPARAGESSFKIFFAAGFHPMEIHRRLHLGVHRRLVTESKIQESFKDSFNEFFAEEILLVRQAANRHETKMVAIGETGFDLSQGVLAEAKEKGYDKSALLALQWQAFEVCLELATELGLPLIFHSRNAWSETEKALLLACGRGLKVMFHCYPGSAEALKKLCKYDCFFSFGGVLTWPNARRMKEAFKVCPLEKLLIESDAPDLPPRLSLLQNNTPSNVGNFADLEAIPQTFVPLENSPLYLKALIEAVAPLRNADPIEIAATCEQNLLKFLSKSGSQT